MFNWVLNTPFTNQTKSYILTYITQWKTSKICSSYYVVQLPVQYFYGMLIHVIRIFLLLIPFSVTFSAIRQEKIRHMGWSHQHPKMGKKHHRYFTSPEISHFPWEYITPLVPVVKCFVDISINLFQNFKTLENCDWCLKHYLNWKQHSAFLYNDFILILWKTNTRILSNRSFSFM